MDRRPQALILIDDRPIASSTPTCSTPTSKPSKPLYDIAARKGFFVQGPDGSVWTARTGRNADVYVFAHNEVVGEQADHRDPAQWRFYVVLAQDLPATKTIGLAAIRVAPVSFCQLGQEVRRVTETESYCVQTRTME